MSVPVNERSQGKLEACTKAFDLATYTLRITKNKKVFTVEYQEALTDKIISLALDISKGNSYRLMQRMDKFYKELWGDNNAC